MDTIEHRYVPRGHVREAFASRAEEILLSGPAGTGKSRAALEKMHRMALKYRDFRGLIVRKTQRSLGSTALVTWRNFVVPESIDSGDVVFYSGSASEPPQYRYWRTQASITIGGMDNPTKIMSSEFDAIYVQEATELGEDDWEILTTRLRNGKMVRNGVVYHQLIGDANPDTPTHWLRMRCLSGQCQMFNTLHTDNPLLYDDDGKVTQEGADYIRKLENLSGVRRDRLFKGLWVAAEGQVYDLFDQDVHLIDGYRGAEGKGPPMSWPRYWSIDFGFVHPFVCQFWATDEDGRLVLYREIHRTQRLVEDHAADILKIVTKRTDGRWREPRPVAIICDHDAEGRATLERHLGMSTVAAHKTVTDGIEAVQSRFKIQKDGRPRIQFARNALVSVDQELVDAKLPTSTIEELPGYVYPPESMRVARSQREHPLKENDDGMDAMRYMVAELDLGGRPRVRFI